MRAIFFVFVFIIYSLSASARSELIDVSCEVKDCNPDWGPTVTKLYRGDGDKKKPAIMWYSGGASTFTDPQHSPISELIGKFDIIMVASPIPVISDSSTKGLSPNAYDERAVYRMKQVTDHYIKLLNKPIWLGGISSGGVRMIAVLSGKDRQADKYAGLIFASTYVSRLQNGTPQYNIPVYDIRYEMNLPILVLQHERDHKPAQQPYLQKWFRDDLAKKNLGKTELVLTTEGDPMITTHDGGHHWFLFNKQEVGRVVSQFITENTR